MRRRALLASAGALFLAGRASARTTQTWRLGTIAPEGSPTAQLIVEFARDLEKQTGGRIRVKTRLGGVLGDERTTFELCRQGRLEVWAGSSGAAAEAVPALIALEAPYLFEDEAHLSRALPPDRTSEGPLARAFGDAGLLPYALAPIGWRGLGTRARAVRLPEDARGLRVRTQPTPLHEATWRAIGAVPHATEMTEVNAAFRLGRVDALDMSVTWVFAVSLADQIKHFTRTDHMIQLALVTIHKGAFRALPAAAQKAILGLRQHYTERAMALQRTSEDELRATLVRQGTAVHTLSPTERQAWRKALRPLEADARRLAGAVGERLLLDIQKGAHR